MCKKYESFPLKVIWNGSKILRGKKSRERTKKRDDKNKENYLLVHN